MKMKDLVRTVIKFRENLGVVVTSDGVYIGCAQVIPDGLWSSTSLFTNEVTLADGVSFNNQDFIDGKVAIVDSREGRPATLHLIDLDPALIENITVKRITTFTE